MRKGYDELYSLASEEGKKALDGINAGAGRVAKSAVLVHESSEFGTGTAKLLQ